MESILQSYAALGTLCFAGHGVLSSASYAVVTLPVAAIKFSKLFILAFSPILAGVSAVYSWRIWKSIHKGQLK